MSDKSKLLSNRSDATLLGEVKSLVQREKEIEIRGLLLARGYSSIYAFATDFTLTPKPRLEGCGTYQGLKTKSEKRLSIKNCS
jgi:hypothetical protein